MRSVVLLASCLGLVVACGGEEASTGAGGAGGSGAGTTSSGGGGGDGGQGGAEATPTDTFYRWLSGRFDSADQAATDPEYFAVQLHACPVDAPELGERVLYIEQAIMTNLGAPYRQRLYVVQPGDDPATDAVSVVFELADPMAFVGACDEAEPRTVAASEAIERAGCAVRASFDGSQFVGGTQGMECESDLNGASYATSEVVVLPELISSWDRGYDAMDVQVWGAVSGPYQFVRRTPLP